MISFGIVAIFAVLLFHALIFPPPEVEYIFCISSFHLFIVLVCGVGFLEGVFWVFFFACFYISVLNYYCD